MVLTRSQARNAEIHSHIPFEKMISEYVIDANTMYASTSEIQTDIKNVNNIENIGVRTDFTYILFKKLFNNMYNRNVVDAMNKITFLKGLLERLVVFSKQNALFRDFLSPMFEKSFSVCEKEIRRPDSFRMKDIYCDDRKITVIDDEVEGVTFEQEYIINCLLSNSGRETLISAVCKNNEIDLDLYKHLIETMFDVALLY